jgi:hypothetical protein
MTYQWRTGDFRAMAGDLLPAFEAANDVNVSSLWT